MKERTHILIVGDKAADAVLAKRAIRRIVKGCEFQVVDSRKGFLHALQTFQPDVILADYTLPQFDGMKALKLTLKHAPLTPLILWTASISEDLAVACMKAGANNYVLKENPKRLGPAVVRALEEKRLLAARKQAEQKYQDIFFNSIEGFFQSSPQGRYLNLNPAIAHLYGYESPAQMIKAITDIATQIYVEPQRRSEFMSLLTSRGSVKNFEARNYRRDGSIIWTSTSARVVRDGNENVLYYEGFIQDITQRKEAEEALQNSEKRFRALIENGLDDISLLAVDGRLLWESPSTVRNLGCAPGEYLGRNIFELMHPDDLEWTSHAYAKLLQEPGGRQSGTFRLRRSDGSWRWVEAIVTNMLNEPGVNAIVINYRDVTDRKEAENLLKEERNLLRTLIDNLPDRIYAMDIQGRKTLSNTADWKASGGKSMEDVLGKTDFEMYPPELAEGFWELDKAVLDSGEPVINYEEPGLDEAGNPVAILTTKIPLRDEQGYVIGLVGIGRDISERKQTEERIDDLLAVNEKILNHSPMGILTYKLTGECVFANQNAASIVGTTVEQLKAQNFNTIESWKRSGLYDLVTRAIATHEEVAADIHHISTFGKDLWMTAHCVTFKSNEEIHALLSILDITERKEAEESLRQSQSRYRALVETQTEFIVRWKPDGIRTFANEAYCRYFGLTSEQALSNSFIPLIHEQDRQSVEEKIRRLISGATSIETEIHRVIKSDGSVGWQEWTDQAVRDDQGHLIELQSVGRDITERKLVEMERQALLEIMQGLANAKDLPEFLKLVHESIARVIYAENFFVVLYQPESGQFEEIYSVDLFDPPAPPARLERSITSFVFRNGKPLLLTRASFDELAARGEVELVGTKSASWLGVPFKKSGETIGVMAVQDYEHDNRYSERDKNFLASIAAQIALVIERKRAEYSLMVERKKAEKYLEIAGVMMLALDREANVTLINQKGCEILGYSADEIIGKNWTDTFLPEATREELRQVFHGLISGDIQSASYYESSIRTKSGEERLIAWHNTLLRDEQGKIISSLSSGEDITERKRAEADLRASEERFRQLAENIQEVFWMTDAESGEELYLSRAAEAIWGRSIDYMMHEPNAFIKSVLPEDQAAVLNALEREKNGEKVEMEYQILRPDGSVRWIWDRAFPILDDFGKVKRIAGVSADITERRDSELALIKSQNRYQELFDSSPVSLWEEDLSLVKKRIDVLLQSGISDFDEYFSTHPEETAQLSSLVRINDVNKASLELYNVQQKEELLKSLTEIIGPDSLDHFHEEVLSFMGPIKRFSWEGVDKLSDGRLMDVVITGSIPYGYEEDWSKVIVSVSDITERKRAEKEIRRRADETSALLATSLALSNLDLKVTLQTIGSSAKTLFAADGCRIFLMEADGETLRCVLTLQEKSDAFSDLEIKIGQGVTGAVAASGRAEIVNEMDKDPRSLRVAAPREEEAIMFAPLKERDRVIGIISIRRAGTTHPFYPSDLELLEAFASMAASAVSNARLFEETQRRLDELQALYENGLAVSRLLEPSEIGKRVIKTFGNYLDWHHVTIRLRKEESDELELVSFSLPHLGESEMSSAARHYSARINKVDQGLSGWVIQTGTQLRTGNVHAHPQYVDTHPGIQSGLYMPLKVGERVIGVISVESETPDAFTEQDERLLATLANQTAVAFENARLYEAMQKELSERKRAEDALRISETHYRALADSITDILFELDQDLRYTHWNKASEALTGIPAGEAIGKSMEEILGTNEEQARIRKIYADILRSHQPRTFETELRIGGENRSFEVNAYPSMRGVSVVAKDVTDRKQSEIILQKRFELMEFSAHHSLHELMQKAVDEVSELTGSTIGFFHFVQPDQTTLGMQTWSTSALRLFQVPLSEGSHLPLDRAGVWAEAVRQRRPLIQNDYEALANKKELPQGHVPIVREMVIPIIRNERLMAVMGVGNKPQDYALHDLEIASRLADYAWDVTERKQMEVALEAERNQLAQRVEERTADLKRANSNLARALRVKDEFLANMSHELRTPLNAILGLSESLGEQIAGPLNEKQQKYVGTISESGHHLLSLINDILDLAKVEAGQITLDINKVDIRGVCQASLRMIKQLAQKKNQEVSLEIDDGLGLMWADERRLKQMIVNLLGNAVKFTPEDGRLGLEVHGDPDANQVSITVWDNGIGIKAGDLERLFQPFVQLDSGLAREASGTGLGLALVAQMARLHGGSVMVESEPGRGSRFTIVVPWEPALAMDAATRMRTTGKFRAIKFDQTNRPRILLVEDTKEVTLMLQDYLEQAGFHVVTAQDGTEAIRQAKLEHPNLILMDVQMPRMNGLEATRKLRSEPDFKYTPIIALTALAMPSDRERCIEAGMDEYISKPVNLKALVKIIQSCLFSSPETRQT